MFLMELKNKMILFQFDLIYEKVYRRNQGQFLLLDKILKIYITFSFHPALRIPSSKSRNDRLKFWRQSCLIDKIFSLHLYILNLNSLSSTFSSFINKLS